MTSASRYKRLKGFQGSPASSSGRDNPLLSDEAEIAPRAGRLKGSSAAEIYHNIPEIRHSLNRLSRSIETMQPPEVDLQPTVQSLSDTALELAQQQEVLRQQVQQKMPQPVQQPVYSAPMAPSVSSHSYAGHHVQETVSETTEQQFGSGDHGGESGFGSLSIWHFPHLVIRNIFAIVVLTAILSGLAFLYTATLQRDFHASAQLLLDPGQFEVRAQDGAGRVGDGIENSRIDGEIFVIRSTRVFRQVVNELNLVDDPVVGTSVSGLAQFFQSEDPAEQAERRVLETIQKLDERVDAARLSPSFIFEVKARHPDAIVAKNIANSIANVFLKLRTEDRRNAEENTANELAERARELLQDLTLKEQAVDDWKRENNIISTGKSGLISDQRLEQLNQQIVTARVALAKAEGELEQVRSLDANSVTAGNLPSFLSSPTIANLRVQFARLSEQEAELDVTLGPKHPKRQVLATKKAQVGKQIGLGIGRLRNSIAQKYDSARSQVAALEREAARQQIDTQETGGAIIELEQRQREVAIALELYQDFQNSSRKLREQASVNLSKAQLVSVAETPLFARGPSKILLLGSALVFSALLAIVIIVAFELMRGSLFTRQQVQNSAGLPIIASLPTRNYDGSSWWVAIFRKFGLMRAKNMTNRQRFVLQGLGSKLSSLPTSGTTPSVCFVSASAKDTTEIVSNLVSTMDADGSGLVLATYGGTAAASPFGESSVQGQRANTKQNLLDMLKADSQSGLCTMMTNSTAERPVRLIVVDAGVGIQGDALSRLIDKTDRTIVTMEIAQTSGSDLSKMVDALLPWRKKMAGILSLGVPV